FELAEEVWDEEEEPPLDTEDLELAVEDGTEEAGEDETDEEGGLEEVAEEESTDLEELEIPELTEDDPDALCAVQDEVQVGWFVRGPQNNGLGESLHCA
ncbi:MAG: hypothetical protein AAB544_04215, partial [Patescibacteria group bacterium]